MDVLKVNAATVGKFTVRVALMETMAVGATPVCVSVTLSVEPSPTGRAVLRGVRRELHAAELAGLSIVSSSEKNFSVRQTGVGVTVGGIAKARKLRIGMCRRGDFVVAIGRPSLGYEVLEGERTATIADVEDVKTLLRTHFVHEVIPVGSQGILKEANILAVDSKLRFLPKKAVPLDMSKSAGPGTVVLCTVAPSNLTDLRRIEDKPMTLIGELR
jgi:thiamine monophosphate kinase